MLCPLRQSFFKATQRSYPRIQIVMGRQLARQSAHAAPLEATNPSIEFTKFKTSSTSSTISQEMPSLAAGGPWNPGRAAQ